MSGFTTIWNNEKQLVLHEVIHDPPTDRATCGIETNPSQLSRKKGLPPVDFSTLTFGNCSYGF